MTNSINYWSISSQILEKEANNLWLEIKIISKSKNTFYITWNWKKILFKSTDFWWNSSLSSKISNDKKLTYQILEELNFPIAKSIYLEKKELSIFKSEKNIQSLVFPLIIKPNWWAHGDGVMMNIHSIDELIKKLEISFLKYKNMIIQEQIEWKEFRVLVLKWEVILVLNRIPPYVIWDGIKNITSLIENINKNPKRWVWYKNIYSNIEIDDELIWYLKKQWFWLESILKEWNQINIRGNSNLWTGWTGKCYTDIICEENKDLCIDICKNLWFEICWVDIISKDISKPLWENWWVILELNDNPWLWWDLEITWINSWRIILEKLFFKNNSNNLSQ